MNHILQRTHNCHQRDTDTVRDTEVLVKLTSHMQGWSLGFLVEALCHRDLRQGQEAWLSSSDGGDAGKAESRFGD